MIPGKLFIANSNGWKILWIKWLISKWSGTRNPQKNSKIKNAGVKEANDWLTAAGTPLGNLIIQSFFTNKRKIETEINEQTIAVNKPEEAKLSVSSVSLLLNEVTMNAMVDKPAPLIASKSSAFANS